ncbi:hypothetical protein SK069_11275 [Patulibacter brassicae]|uniref:Uncharacterized protein n=1 Tax=Patulibacter brassicae TaxID=1705717 RepID=A0ABU4VMR2_9ACTN|nr:hypothetical protein [Patulibacter brassicae]MDX8152178.1 hypothetical protein [Patulibacter brassicae]
MGDDEERSRLGRRVALVERLLFGRIAYVALAVVLVTAAIVALAGGA